MILYMYVPIVNLFTALLYRNTLNHSSMLITKTFWIYFLEYKYLVVTLFLKLGKYIPERVKSSVLLRRREGGLVFALLSVVDVILDCVTVCPRSLDLFYIVSHYTNWTYSTPFIPRPLRCTPYFLF